MKTLNLGAALTTSQKLEALTLQVCIDCDYGEFFAKIEIVSLQNVSKFDF